MPAGKQVTLDTTDFDGRLSGSDSDLQAAIDTLNNFERGHIDGLHLTNGTDADHDVDIAPGACRDAANGANLVLAATLTKQIDHDWSVGDDAGGLDTGSVAARTVYAIWLIQRSDTGVVDALFSLSFSSPTMPTNYDKKRLIGSVATQAGAANLRTFLQRGDLFWYFSEPSKDIEDSSMADDTFETGTLLAAPNSLASVSANMENPTTTVNTGRIVLRRVGQTGVDATANSEALAVIQAVADFREVTGRDWILTDDSAQIQYSCNEEGATTSTVIIQTWGFLMFQRSNPDW